MNWYKKAQNNPAPFLETPESAWKWAKDNIDLDIKDVNTENISDYDREIIDEHIENSEKYSYRYHSVKDKKTITIYRAIRIKNLDDINWNKIGTHWSFEKRGAGVYASAMKTKDIILTGIVEPKYIDWTYCFTSFMYYGESQWECALKHGSPVQIIYIDNNPVNIKASA